MQFIDYTDPATFRQALKATLCRNKIQAEEFDEIFDQYWKQLGKAVDSKTKEDTCKKEHLYPNQSNLNHLKAWLHGNRTDETEETATYSIQENLSQKDFSSIPEEDVDELMQIIRAVAKTTRSKSQAGDIRRLSTRSYARPEANTAEKIYEGEESCWKWLTASINETG